MLRRQRLDVPTAAIAALLLATPLAAELPSAEYDETIELIELVGDAAQLVEDKGFDFACGEFCEPGTRWFQDEIFVFDMEGNASLGGQALLELRDPQGKPIIETFVRELEI